MGGAAAGAKVERHHQRGAATDAMALDGRDGDLVHLLPGPTHLGAEPLLVNALADRQPIARAPFGILEIEAGAKALAEPVRITTDVSRSSSKSRGTSRSSRIAC